MGLLFMYALYSALLALFLVLTLPYWLLQMMKHGKYRAGLRQRFGAVPPALAGRGETPAIWVHAVSVGEVVASSAVVKALQQEFPSHRVLVSTTTSTGQKLAAQRFGAENVFYFPLDFAFAVRPYLDALRPELVVVAETENCRLVQPSAGMFVPSKSTLPFHDTRNSFGTVPKPASTFSSQKESR